MKLLNKLSIAALMVALSFPLYAMSLNEAMSALGQAKASGAVGEQANGYLGVIKNDARSAEIAQLINNARKDAYQKVAQKNGITLNDVEKMAGEKSQAKTPAGQYIQVNGQWQKK